MPKTTEFRKNPAYKNVNASAVDVPNKFKRANAAAEKSTVSDIINYFRDALTITN